MRLAAVHASPMLRILAAIAPATASSRSASSKTMNGALPPSSIDVRRTFSAHCASSTLPTSVEPVNDSLRAQPGTDQRLHHGAACTQVTMFMTPSRQARLEQDGAEGQHRQRGLVGGLETHRAPGGDGGADLARAHGHREVPRRDEQARADRLPGHQETGAARGGRLVAAVDAQGLGGEVAQELGGVGDLALGLGHRLAHLQRHEQGEVVDALVEQLEGPGEDVGALPRAAPGEAGLRPHGGVEGPRPSAGPASATEHSTSPVDGSRTSKVAPPVASTHVPPMRSCRGTAETTADSLAA